MTPHRAALLLASLMAPAIAAAQPAPDPDPVAARVPVAAPGPVSDPAPDPDPAPEPAGDDLDDLDLVGLGLDSDDRERLNLYGFMDVGFSRLVPPDNALWKFIIPAEPSFAVGNLNLYLTRALSERWRSLLEVRFTYAPAGTKNADGTFVSTTAPDPANAYRPMSWGGVKVERAYLEYDATDALTVQVGSFLTPYGIWNVDHGSPVIIPTLRPWIIGEELFPQQQTGVHVYGQRPVGAYTVSYHATLSNGRGPLQSFRDLDDNKALGGRLELATGWLGSTRLGLSGYRGRFTDRPANRLVVDENGQLETIVPAGTSFDESALGVDVLVERGALRVQAEVIANRRTYRAGARALGRTGFVPDGQYVGSYVLVGHRFDRWWQVMPFVLAEVDDPRTDPEMGDTWRAIQVVGVNLRPLPSVVLKAEYASVQALGSPRLTGRLQIFALQAAWAF